MDSRHYIFSFGLEALSDVPSDFDLPTDLDALETGVFLPQGDTDWFGRRKYPARILLLTKREVVVVAHPTAGEPLSRVPVDSIYSVECGRILLLGWVSFSWAGGSRDLSYNTRTAGPVGAYVERFMDQWLPEVAGLAARDCVTVGKPLNPKFEYARSAELLAGERPLVQFFQPASFGSHRDGIFRRKTRRAGDLLAATSRRILWITERHRGQYEPYGVVSRSAPLASLSDLRRGWADGSGDLEIVLGHGRSWRLPLRCPEEREAREFEAALRGIL